MIKNDSFEPYFDDKHQKLLLHEEIYSLPEQESYIISAADDTEDDEAILTEENQQEALEEIGKILNQTSFDSQTTAYLKKIDRLTAISSDRIMEDSLLMDDMISDEYDIGQYGLLPDDESEYELSDFSGSFHTPPQEIEPEDILECDEPVYKEIEEILYLKLCGNDR